jgi:hypothetical protein
MREGSAAPGRASLAWGWLVFLFAPSLYAQANYESALIGGRSSLMGGTGVAAGVDSAAPLQNPATIIGIEGTSFVFSTFFLQLTQRKFTADLPNVADIERGSTNLNQTDVRVLPNSTCLFFDLYKVPGQARGHHKASICVAEPESQSFTLGTTAVGESIAGRSGLQQRFLSQTFSKKVYAASWAFALSEQFSLGVSPMLETVSFKDEEAIATVSTEQSIDQAVGSPGKNATNIVVRNADSYALSALVGARYRPSTNLSLGVSVLTPSLSIAGSYRATRSYEATATDDETYAEERGSARFTYPLRIALGVAGRVGRLGFEVDGFIHTGRGDFAVIDATRTSVGLGDGIITEVGTDPVHYQEAVRPVANFGLGLEYTLSKTWSLLAGALTDFSGMRPRSGLGSDAIFHSQMDAIHGSLGVAWKPPAGSVLLGVRGFFGEGDMAVTTARMLPPSFEASGQSQWGLALVVSGQLTLEMIASVDPTGLLKNTAAPAPKSP